MTGVHLDPDVMTAAFYAITAGIVGMVACAVTMGAAYVAKKLTEWRRFEK